MPIDVAAIGMHADLDWSTLLLAEGLVATATFGWAALTERSVVLRWAFAVAAVALAGGIGATTALPAPLVLAGFAAIALVARRHDACHGWAAIAGLAPLLTFVDRLTFTGAGTFERLGLVGEQPRAAAVLTGVIAATVLRHRRVVACGDVGLVLIGTAGGRGRRDRHRGAAATSTAARPSSAWRPCSSWSRLVAFATRHDEFWQRSPPTSSPRSPSGSPAWRRSPRSLRSSWLRSSPTTDVTAALAVARPSGSDGSPPIDVVAGRGSSSPSLATATVHGLRRSPLGTRQ